MVVKDLACSWCAVNIEFTIAIRKRTSDLVVEIIATIDMRPSSIEVEWTVSCGVNDTPATFG